MVLLRVLRLLQITTLLRELDNGAKMLHFELSIYFEGKISFLLVAFVFDSLQTRTNDDLTCLK